jgi:dihydroneopterin aldolase/2-amino-4-hydroxy-6-hydroxymethyldihydropteridine diphosphokinase/dihydropteroate synthase
MIYDKIIIKNLVARHRVGVDSWQREKVQTVKICLTLFTDINEASQNDTLTSSHDYGEVTRTILSYVEQQSTCRTLEALTYQIARICCLQYGVDKVKVKIIKPSALLYAHSVAVEMMRSKEDFMKSNEQQQNVTEYVDECKKRFRERKTTIGTDCMTIRKLSTRCIIGMNPWERQKKQNVNLHVEIWGDLEAAALTDSIIYTYNFQTLSEMLLEFVEGSFYKTIEALASFAAEMCVQKFKLPRVVLRVEKPNALLFADYASVEVERCWKHEKVVTIEKEEEKEQPTTLVYLGLGSNLGNRAENIRMALQLLSTYHDGLGYRLLDTSFLYETQPMYITGQPMFLNAACKIETRLEPEALLDVIQDIEVRLGRQKDPQDRILYGPRLIDVDILFYGHMDYVSKRLIIPHPRLHERAFVLRPLCDIARHLEHPTLQCTIEQLLLKILNNHNDSNQCNVFPRAIPIDREHLWYWDQRTLMMGILNVTPDSFSDGGLYIEIDKAVLRAHQMAEEGVDMIDIGGMSTRPGADEISEEEELARVIPVIRKLREEGNIQVPLSIDTCRSRVAYEAIHAGAQWINDVSGGLQDPDMLRIMAELDVPVCLMHRRGNTKTMMGLVDYKDNDIIRAVRDELSVCVKRALLAGIKRWHIVIDPGIGFAKYGEQNLKILRELYRITERGSELERFPLLIGPSRKSFIGRILGQSDPCHAVWGTAAVCSACISGGVHMIRVHDVKEMHDVIRVADAIWKPLITLNGISSPKQSSSFDNMKKGT